MIVSLPLARKRRWVHAAVNDNSRDEFVVKRERKRTDDMAAAAGDGVGGCASKGIE